MSDKFFVIIDCETGNEYTSDVLPLLREYGADLAIDAIWQQNGESIEYGQIDIFPSGWAGDERLAEMLGILPQEFWPAVAGDLADDFEVF